MNIRYGIVCAAVAGTLMIGCATPPDRQVEVAFAALATADSLEADLYVPELFDAARDSFAAAQDEIAYQEAETDGDADYTHAKDLLAFATATAEDAATQVPARKEEVRVETDSLIAQAQVRLAAVHDALAANVSAPSTITTVSLEQQNASAQIVLQQAVEAQAGGEFASANDLVSEALMQIEALELRLQNQETVQPRS